MENLSEDLKKKYSQCGYELQKVAEALLSRGLKTMITKSLPEFDVDVKNNQDSNLYREKGNENFVIGDNDKAIENYTKSLAFATDKESMALALANRSAALYRKELYQECLIDIDGALTYGYPEEKKNKLKERAQSAILNLQQTYKVKDQNMNDLPAKKDSESLLQIDKNNVLESKTSLSMVKEFIKSDNVSKENSECCSTEDLETLTSTILDTPTYFPKNNKLELTSDEAPALHSGVSIAYSNKYGRHVVATKSFKSGDLILKENPFAYIIYTKKHYTHCHHCLARSYNLIPCSKCPFAQYCSENCKTLAWKMAHQIECSILPSIFKLLNAESDKTLMMMKIIRLLIVSTENGAAINKLQKDIHIAGNNSDKRTVGFTDAGIFDSNSAVSAFSLSTNLISRPATEVCAFTYISALAVILLATRSNFFGKEYEPDELHEVIQRKDVIFCGSLIFLGCFIESCNSFSIQQEPGIKVGSGMYITASLLNHSCTPNTFRYFDGLTMYTRTLEPVKEGDQLFTSYGGGYQIMPRDERRNKMMREYYFKCECKACIDDWPTYTDILKNHIGTIAKTNKKLVKKLKPFRNRLLVDKYDIEAVVIILELLHAEVKMPCEEIIHATQYLKSYFLDP